MTAAPSAPTTAAERLRRVFAAGRFVITAELESPRHASAAHVERQARGCAAYVDAVTCTDNALATVRMSPVAMAALVARNGLLPLVQLTGRDRNRIALQSDVLGAAAVGAAGVVCLSGDPPGVGNEPDATMVRDFGSLELMAAVRRLCAGSFASGQPVSEPPDLLIGGVQDPAMGDAAIRRLHEKADAGMTFVQTQVTFDPEQFASWLERVRAEGLHERVRIMAGIGVIRRARLAHSLHEQAPGIVLPPPLLARFDADPESGEVGVDIAVEILRQVRELPGVAGANLIGFGWMEGVRRVVDTL